MNTSYKLGFIQRVPKTTIFLSVNWEFWARNKIVGRQFIRPLNDSPMTLFVSGITPRADHTKYDSFIDKANGLISLHSTLNKCRHTMLTLTLWINNGNSKIPCKFANKLLPVLSLNFLSTWGSGGNRKRFWWWKHLFVVPAYLFVYE